MSHFISNLSTYYNSYIKNSIEKRRENKFNSEYLHFHSNFLRWTNDELCVHEYSICMEYSTIIIINLYGVLSMDI